MNGSISVAGLDAMRSFGVEVVLVDVSPSDHAYLVPGALRPVGDPAVWLPEIAAGAFLVIFDAEGTERVSDLLVPLARLGRSAHYLIGGAREYRRVHDTRAA